MDDPSRRILYLQPLRFQRVCLTWNLELVNFWKSFQNFSHSWDLDTLYEWMGEAKETDTVDMSQLLSCIASKICIKEGRVYHRRFRVKLKAIWGRQKVIDAIQIVLESELWSQLFWFLHTKLDYNFYSASLDQGGNNNISCILR